MEYPDSVRFLYALGNELKTAKFGLERVARVAEALGDPHRRPRRFVHVAGTNGKGSTCAFIESGLRASGLRTGLFTSPHLISPTERIRIDGTPVGEDEFALAFNRVHAVAEKLIAADAIDTHPSYFETLTAMAFLVFREREVNVAVLETGLGGRLDATNIVEPEICAITRIDFDHEQILGSTIEAIAGEKAGIIKSGVPVVMARQRLEAAGVIKERARALGSELIETSPDFVEGVSLAGMHQQENAQTAIAVLKRLGIGWNAIDCGVRTTRWPGRIERVSRDPEIIVDGAHNPNGARALAAYVSATYRDPKPVLIFGVMREKAAEEMAGILFPLFREVIVTAPDQPRALAPEIAAELADHPQLRTARNLRAALGMAKFLGGPIFITGSLFLVGEAMGLLRGAPS